jgi:uncharacterized repeat protein (TIGR01451 family)
MLKRLAALIAAVLASATFITLPAGAANQGDVWVTNSTTAGAGHATEPHLLCTTVYVHGASLDPSGTYDIASIPGTGSGLTIWSGLAWSTPATGDVLASFSGSALIAAAISQDSAVANTNQGYHFKLTLHQASGDKTKTFWVDCQAASNPTLSITKTADQASVVAGSDIGFTMVAAPDAGSYANNVTLDDPLPMGAGLNWFLSPAYAGPGTCSITGTAPAQQTLECSFGDLGSPGTASASVHVVSHTIAGTTAALSSSTVANTASATADQVTPVSSTASVVVTPAPAALTIAKTADAASVTAGSPVGFTITVGNTGPGVAVAATMNDPLPSFSGDAWSVSPAYSGPGSCSINGTSPAQTLSCSYGNLAAGASVSVHVTTTTPTGTAVSLTNVATAKAQNNGTVTATASTATIVPPVTPIIPITPITPPLAPALTITKTADAASVTAGRRVGFTITVGNTGPGVAVSATMNDPLPSFKDDAWSIRPAYSGPGSCSISGTGRTQVLSCYYGNLAAGASVSVHVVTTTPKDRALSLTNVATAQAQNNGVVTATAHTVTIVDVDTTPPVTPTPPVVPTPPVTPVSPVTPAAPVTPTSTVTPTTTVTPSPVTPTVEVLGLQLNRDAVPVAADAAATASVPAAVPVVDSTTQVLATSLVRTGTLPMTGGVPIQLAYLGAIMVIAGGLVLLVDRTRNQAS